MLEQVIEEQIHRQFVRGVHDWVNAMVRALQMQQNKHDSSCVGKFVRTDFVHAQQLDRPAIRNTPLPDERPPHAHPGAADQRRLPAPDEPRRRVLAEPAQLLGAGCSQRAK